MGVSKWGIFLGVIFSSMLSFGSTAASSKKELRGKVEISVAEDLKKNQVITRYFLKDKKTGKKTELHFKKGKLPTWLAPEQEIVVSGTQESGALSTESAALITDSSVSLAASEKIIKSTLIIIADMDGGTGGITLRDAESAMYGSNGSVRDLYLKNSFGKVDFIPDADGNGKSDIYGPVRLTQSLTAGCNYSQWSDEAVKLAEQAYGVNAANYTYRMIIMPANIRCFWNGLAVGDTAFVKGYDGANTTFVMAHELGHLMGMGHAAIDDNNDGVVDSEYGDQSCDMGNNVPDLRFVNGPHAYQQGFYADYPGKVLTVTQNQTVEIWPLEVSPTNSPGAQIVRVPRVGTSEYYYLSIRNPTSYMKSMASLYTDGVSIHRAGATPYYSYFVRSLTAGSTWEDLVGGVRITAVKKNSGSIVVSIEINDSGCVPRAPTFTSSGNALISKSGSGTVEFSLSITNNDSLACAATQFVLNSVLPAGVTSSYSGYSLKLVPGAKINLYMDVKYQSLLDGTYPIQFKLVDSDGVAPLHTDSLFSTSMIIDMTPPTAPQNLSAVSGTRGRVDLSWSPSQDQMSDPCYTIYRDSGYGFNQVGSTCESKFSDYTSGTIIYMVKAIDRAGNQSSESNQVSFVSKTRSGRGK